MSTTTITLDMPALEGTPVTKHRRTSFNHEIGLAELGNVSRDLSAEKEGSVVSAIQECKAGQQLSLVQERVFVAALCCGAFLCGWNDGTLGPLLPRIQENYHVSEVSLSRRAEFDLTSLSF